MRYKHIIWDWNGTLLDDTWLCVEGINQALIKRNLTPISADRYREVFTFPVKDYYMKLGFDFDKEPFEIAGDEFVSYYEEYFHKTKLQNECRFVLRAIQSNSISQSILSAGRQDFLLDWVSAHKLEKYFLKIIGIDNQYAKGKVEQGIKLINDLPYNEEDIVIVGDTIHDSDVAEKLKINCVLIDHGHVSGERLKKTGRIVSSNFRDLIPHIL